MIKKLSVFFGENKNYKIVRDLMLVFITGFISAFGINYFILSNNFIPLGINGIAVMANSLFGTNVAVVSLAFNIPLLITSFFFINKKFVFYTLLFILVNAIFLFVLAEVNIVFNTEGKNVLLDAVFAGVLLGLRTGILVRIGGSSGGLDIVAALIQKKLPSVNFEKILFYLGFIIIGASFFVYGQNVYSVILSIVFNYILTYVVNFVLEGYKSVLEFKIITSEADSLIMHIISELKHGVTVTKVKGGFTEEEKIMLICVVNKREIANFKNIICCYKGTFAYITVAKEVIGNFRRGKWEIPK